MTAQTPIPLRADPAALRQAERRSFMRAAAAAFIGHRDREDPVKWLVFRPPRWTVTTFPDRPRPPRLFLSVCRRVAGIEGTVFRPSAGLAEVKTSRARTHNPAVGAAR
jgi:hypothetical protein